MTFSQSIKSLLLVTFCLVISACYTLNGVSISADTNTYYVDQFDVTTTEAPQEIGQQFSEILKQKINNNTRLSFAENNPDVEFIGAVVKFTVTPEAPNAQNQADLNRLTVEVSVEYVDNKTEMNSYKKTFSDFEQFSTTENLFDVQVTLVEAIFERISEDAFNSAFSNW